MQNIEDIGEAARAVLRARTGVAEPIGAGQARAIAGQPPAGPARPVVAGIGEGAAPIARRPPVVATSDLRSQVRSDLQRPSPVDRDVAAARAQQDARFRTPTAATPATAAPAAGGTASRVGQAAGQATRAAVDAGKRFVAPPSAPNRVGGPTAAGVAAGTAIGSAIDSFKRPTTDYYTRLGLDPALAGQDTISGTARDVAVRGAGVLSDFGAALLDIPVDIANLAGADMRPFREMFADRRTSQTYSTDGGAPKSAPAAPAAAAAATAATAGSPAAAGEPAKPRVLGTFNGREITEADAAELAGRVTTIPSARQPTAQERATSIIDGIRATNAAQDADFGNLVRSSISERRGRADRAEQRIDDLRSAFDTAIFQGKRRKAAVIADALRTEAGIVQGLGAGQVPDTRRQGPTFSPTDVADAGLKEADTAKTNLEVSRQQRINALMEQFAADPESDAGQQAGRMLQMLQGGQQEQKLYPVDFPGGIDEFGSPITARGLVDTNGRPVFNPFNGQQPQAASSPIVGQATGPDGKLYNIRADGTPEPAE
jgi:hypothetical protein